MPPRWNCSAHPCGIAPPHGHCLLPWLATSFLALHLFERLDWDFVVHRLIVAAEWAAGFGLVLRMTERTPRATLADPSRR